MLRWTNAAPSVTVIESLTAARAGGAAVATSLDQPAALAVSMTAPTRASRGVIMWSLRRPQYGPVPRPVRAPGGARGGRSGDLPPHAPADQEQQRPTAEEQA